MAFPVLQCLKNLNPIFYPSPLLKMQMVVPNGAICTTYLCGSRVTFLKKCGDPFLLTTHSDPLIRVAQNKLYPYITWKLG